jgi:hypothetical protein
MNFKKIASLIAAAAAALTLASCSSSSDQAPAGMITASGDAALYDLYVPDDWSVDISTGMTCAYVSKNDPSSVSVTTWTPQYTDTTLDDWWEGYLSDISLAFDNVTEISSENTLLGGEAAVRHEYTATFADVEYHYMVIGALHGDIVYVFTYTSQGDSYEDNMDDVNTVLEYFDYRS